MLYNVMVLPYFNYCSITWSTADQKHQDVLERLHQRVGRMVLGVPSITSTREVYDKLKLQLERWRETFECHGLRISGGKTEYMPSPE